MKAFNLCLPLVLLAATVGVGGQSINVTDTCSMAGGICTDASNCTGQTQPDGCPSNQICCVGVQDACSNNTLKCQNLGGQCYNSSGNQTCDFVKENTCASGCGCCIDCEKQKPCRKCWRLYRGKCQATCGPDYLRVSRCRAGCKCCGCKKLKKCKDAGGSCVTNRSRCCGRVRRNWCRGRRCFCCLPV